MITVNFAIAEKKKNSPHFLHFCTFMKIIQFLREEVVVFKVFHDQICSSAGLGCLRNGSSEQCGVACQGLYADVSEEGWVLNTVSCHHFLE